MVKFMRIAVLVLILLPCVVRAQSVVYGHRFALSLIDRPLILPDNAVEVGLLGNVSYEGSNSSGFAGALGVEIGSGAGQAGLVIALPVNPDFGFGSVVGSLAYGINRQTAFRVDIGFDHVSGHAGRPDTNYYYGSAGLPTKVRISPWLALVSGRVGALDTAHFINLNDGGGNGLYRGAGFSPFSSSNLVTFTSEEDGPGQLALNLPIGLLAQLSQSFSVTLRTGYQLFIDNSSGDVSTQHFIPVGLDAVYGPTQAFDLGASFSLPGPIATTGSVSNPGYSDIRLAVLWLRFRG
jgi:hypothetical protein